MRHILRAVTGGLTLWSGFAWGALQVIPTRVVLTDQTKVANLTLRHTGAKAGHYKVSAIFYRMKPDGGIDMVTDPKEAERPLLKYLRFSPRQVTIPPNLEQVVKVMVAAPAALPDGEYRAHLHFEPGQDDEAVPMGTTKQGKISMRLEARIAVAIPVVFKHGKAAYEAKISELSVVKMPADKTTAFSAVLESQGNAFPYGDIYAFFTPAGSGETRQVGLVRGVSSYVPRRTVSYPLEVPSGTALKNGTLKLEFREAQDSAAGADGKVITSAEASLP